MTHHPFPPQPATPTQSQRVLVLQGGGALGSYQAGAYQALCHFDFEPEWVAGISIGAINAAIIAGNDRDKRVGRLKELGRTSAEIDAIFRDFQVADDDEPEEGEL